MKIFNIALISFGFIIAIILLKYKPMYEVKISGEKVGYVQNMNELDKEIEQSVNNYKAKNISKIELAENPEYELKLVQKAQEDNQEEVIIALQKDAKITYKYYDILLDKESIESVNTEEEAKELLTELNNSELSIEEKITENIEEINTDDIEVAKNNILLKTKQKENTIAEINGIKIATKPVSGVISSRYGVSSSIRSSTHTGLDIAAPKGTSIKVVADGTIIFAQYNGSYGNLIKVDHGNGVETWYAHTSKINVKVGQNVKAGDIIALVGSTGNSTGAHLH